jgi:hypothetical protein
MLIAAHAVASPTQALVLSPLIAQAREVHNQLRALLGAAMAELAAKARTFRFDGATYSLQSMLDANSDDTGLCEWLQHTAKVGENFNGCTRVE